MDVSSGRSNKRARSKPPRKYLPGDIVAAILSRLPIKSVVRFGCASKLWFEIVGGRDFQHSHFNRSLVEPPNVMALTREKGVITMNLSHGRILPPCNAAFGHIITSRPHDYANTCNGLLCFVSPEDGSVLLCNPIIGELIALPPPPASAPPFSAKYSVGLGFSPSTREYKVVRLSYSPATSTSSNQPAALLLTAEVCTLGSPASSSRHVRGGGGYPCPCPCPPDGNPLHLEGKIHWMHRKRIVSFDVGSEVFVTPPPIPDFGPDTVLVELGGNLSLIDLSSPCHIPVWVLKDPVHNRWDQACILSTHPPLDLNPRASRLTSIWEHGGSLLIWLQDQWITLDLKTMQQKYVLGEEMQLPHDWNWEVCGGYRISLVSLKSTDIAEGGRKGGVITFAWESDLPCAGVQNSLGFTLEKVGIMLKLLPDYARLEPSSVQDLLTSYTRAVRADRRLLGPHIYRTVKQAPRGGVKSVGVKNLGSFKILFENSDMQWLMEHGKLPAYVLDQFVTYKIWMGWMDNCA